MYTGHTLSSHAHAAWASPLASVTLWRLCCAISIMPENRAMLGNYDWTVKSRDGPGARVLLVLTRYLGILMF